MSFLDLNLYRHPNGVAFDPAKVIAKVKAWFPEAVIVPGDQAAAEVQRAELAFAESADHASQDVANQIVGSLRRKAKRYGPSYAFSLPLPGGGDVQGLARSVNVQFLFPEPLPEEVRQRLIAFLKSLGVGRLEASVPGNKQVEVLADLRGPSDCLREDVPWAS